MAVIIIIVFRFTHDSSQSAVIRFAHSSQASISELFAHTTPSQVCLRICNFVVGIFLLLQFLLLRFQIGPVNVIRFMTAQLFSSPSSDSMLLICVVTTLAALYRFFLHVGTDTLCNTSPSLRLLCSSLVNNVRSSSQDFSINTSSGLSASGASARNSASGASARNPGREALPNPGISISETRRLYTI
ncbi:hypothetical protein ACHAWU_006947 [Discostella pseudostelligera]|uniref:Uncharacterized protein n=1 Tax=Discostella pseudostelligera TaxID=259834 RepID=A0ABD3N3R1_9STRA